MNIGEYIKHLRKEKGLSQKELSDNTGISTAEISRIETGGRQKPSPDVLKVIAPVLEVQYEELMNRAGYLNDRSFFMQEVRDAEEKFIEIVTPKLIKEGWMVELCKGPSIGDILAKKDNFDWYIDFKMFRSRSEDERNFRNEMMARDLATRIYGRLAIYNKAPINKYTIALSNKNIFDVFLKHPPVHLNVSVSIMLIDFDTNSIIDEFQLTENKPFF